MLIAFEPVGETFMLPPNDQLQFLISEEEMGLGTDSLEIQIKLDEKKENLSVSVWSEKNAFQAFYNGLPVSL